MAGVTLRTLLPRPPVPRPSFTADWRFWDELRTEELKPGGAHIPVTNDNRQACPLGCWSFEDAVSPTGWTAHPEAAHLEALPPMVQEYVRLYTEWLLERSISQQFNAFRKGFLRVCGWERGPVFANCCWVGHGLWWSRQPLGMHCL